MVVDEPFTVTDARNGHDGTAPAPVFVLRVATGPDVGQSIVLDWSARGSYLLGQGPLCELRLSDAKVSRRHLSFTPEGGLVRVTDLESRNGTRVGGVRVEAALLTGGELIEVGETQLRLARTPAHAVARSAERKSFGRVLGQSFDMQSVFDLAAKLAGSPLNVLIEGETGTGKELLAEAIHEMGTRAAGPFVSVDCTVEPTLLDVQLFGDDREGAIEQAHRGTLVLAEIGELDERLQTRLLEVVETGVVRRASVAGGRRLDVRFIATSRRDADRDVEGGRLKEELLFRLAGARLELPPLRRRYGDVALLAAHFWQLYGGSGEPPKALLLKLSRGTWPGNVRELQNAVASAVLTDEREPPPPPALAKREVAASDIISETLAMNLSLPQTRQLVMREVERRFVERALSEHSGNITRAAAACGLTRRYFHVLLAASRSR